MDPRASTVCTILNAASWVANNIPPPRTIHSAMVHSEKPAAKRCTKVGWVFFQPTSTSRPIAAKATKRMAKPRRHACSGVLSTGSLKMLRTRPPQTTRVQRVRSQRRVVSFCTKTNARRGSPLASTSAAWFF